MTRWKDTLPDVVPDGVPSLAWAAWALAVAVRAHAGASRDLSAASAAAHIRAYRKSLGVETRRQACVYPDLGDEHLLWRALAAVTWAARGDEPEYAARQCRSAEADLRELWQRGQS